MPQAAQLLADMERSRNEYLEVVSVCKRMMVKPKEKGAGKKGGKPAAQ